MTSHIKYSFDCSITVFDRSIKISNRHIYTVSLMNEILSGGTKAFFMEHSMLMSCYTHIYISHHISHISNVKEDASCLS